MFRRRTASFALVLLLVTVIALRADETDDLVKAEMQKQHIPALSLAVIRDGKIIKAKGYGLANVELNVPATAETVYKIGSVSKQFIAAGILLLVQENKINLDDKISKFLDGTPDTWKEITVRHLLTHTSGMVRDAPGFDPLKIQTDADVIKSAYSSPLGFTPGDRSEYSNTGYFTLAEIIRKVSAKLWEDFLNERLFAPLAMSATRTTTNTEIIPNRADGYVWRANKLENANIFIALRPSGAFLSSVLDLAKWDAALYNDRILKQSLRDQMWSPFRLNNGSNHPYGFGWYLDTVGGHKLVRHGGSLPGFRAEFVRFGDDKLTVAILANGDNANLSPIALAVADRYIPDLIPKRTVAKLENKILDSHAGQYQPNPRTTFTITRDGNRLMMQQGAGNQKRELLPETEVKFFTTENPRLTFSFLKDESGQVTFLVLQEEGREVGRAKKIN